jgi:general secretion pathway protein D
VGITLRVLPRINAGDTIRLQVNQEASSIAEAQTQAASDLVTNRRAINTTVLADNGQTIVLGGLITDDRQDSRQQVPILGDIPIVGELFKSRRESRQKRTLFIFLKPTILRDPADAAAAAKDKYARLRSEEIANTRRSSLLLAPPTPRLTVEIDGIY